MANLSDLKRQKYQYIFRAHSRWHLNILNINPRRRWKSTIGVLSSDESVAWSGTMVTLALNALQRNAWVHLACHGKQDREQPCGSQFATRDKPLTSDEVIHLAAGLQFLGFTSVIGTPRVVDDDVAKHIVEAFYENKFEDFEDGGVTDCMKEGSLGTQPCYERREDNSAA